MYYIQETDKPNFVFKTFRIIKLKEDKIILPINEEKISSKYAKKLADKTMKILREAISKKIIISNKIKKQEEYTNLLHTYNLEIINGRWLFEILSCEVLDYISKQKNIKKSETQISILINDLTDTMVYNIKQIAKEYKKVNIITNHIEKFKKIEEHILEKYGIMITVGNNKKRGLSKSKIILNVDFPLELVNQYNIYENAIIINIKGNIKITKKRFNGITINDYDITFKQIEEIDYDKNNKYKKNEIYEAQIIKKQLFQDIKKQIKKDNVKIVRLISLNNKF